MNYFVGFLKSSLFYMSKQMEMCHYKHGGLEQRATMMNFRVVYTTWCDCGTLPPPSGSIPICSACKL